MRYLEQRQVDRVRELIRYGGSGVYRRVASRGRLTGAFFGFVMESMATLVGWVERGEDWKKAALAGHTLSRDMYQITLAESMVLYEQGIKTVGHLFKDKEFGVGKDIKKDTEYNEIIQGCRGLVDKCKHLRKRLENEVGGYIGQVGKGFFEEVSVSKLSRQYRALSREQLDKTMKGPPAYFTRRAQGIMVPSLEEFKKGYRNIIRMEIASKTREVAFLTMNRQIWTGQKGLLSNIGENQTGQCTYCGEVEDTKHMLFDCKEYSSKVWEIMSEAINWVILKMGCTGSRYSTHLYEIMYCRPPPRIQSKIGKEIQIYICLLYTSPSPRD